MRTNDIKAMTNEELNAKLISTKTELFNLRFQHATGNLANPMLLHTLKKDIAKIKTILTERKLGISADVVNKSVKKEEKVLDAKIKTAPEKETKTTAKAAPKTATKAGVKAAPKAESKTTAKAAPKATAAKAETKAATKSAPKAAAKKAAPKA